MPSNNRQSHHSQWSDPAAINITPTNPSASLGSQSADPTAFTPSPGSSASSGCSLPFVAGPGPIGRASSDQSEHQQVDFGSRPTSGSEQGSEFVEDASFRQSSGDPAHAASTGTSSVLTLQPAHKDNSATATDRMRSLNFFEELPQRPDRFTADYSAFLGAQGSLHKLHPSTSSAYVDSGDSDSQTPPKSSSSGRLTHPIQPIDGPPPQTLHRAKGPWHKAEDRALMYWVSHLGTGKWVEIARRVGSRTGKQCRERWTNQLSPEIDHSAFRHEEDLVIITMQQTLQANKWCEVAKYLPGRPENAIKNRWNSRDLQRKRTELQASAFPGTTSDTSLGVVGAVDLGHGPPSDPATKRPRSHSDFDYNPLGDPYANSRTPASKRSRPAINPKSLEILNPVHQLAANPGGSTSNLVQHTFHKRPQSSIEAPPAKGQDAWGRECFSSHSTTPPSSTRLHQLQTNNPSLTSAVGSYYSTPTHSPGYLLNSSTANSLISSATSQAHYPASVYEEIPTPTSGSLIGVPYPPPIFETSCPSNILNSNLYYNHHENPSDRSLNFDVGMDETGVGSQTTGSMHNNFGQKVVARFDHNEDLSKHNALLR